MAALLLGMAHGRQLSGSGGCRRAGPGRPNLDDCYFYRISNCSLADAGVAPNRTSEVPPLRFSDERTLLRVRVRLRVPQPRLLPWHRPSHSC
jgi:hypothetical protein